jgi:hypothetical protein
MMLCPEPERLSAWLDGDLPPGETARLRDHAAGCARCGGLVTELMALIGAAGQLDSPEPPPTLWRGIEGSLDRLPEPAGPQPAATWFGRLAWRPFAIGALVGSLAAAAVIFPTVRSRFAVAPDPGSVVGATPSSLLAVAAPPSDPLLAEAEAEFARAAAAYERSIEKLRGLLDHAEQGWSVAERVRTAERLARLDEVIERSRDFARRTPGDSAGNEELFAAYQQKIAFLAAAVHRGGEWNVSRPRGDR